MHLPPSTCRFVPARCLRCYARPLCVSRVSEGRYTNFVQDVVRLPATVTTTACPLTPPAAKETQEAPVSRATEASQGTVPSFGGAWQTHGWMWLCADSDQTIA